MPARRTGVSIPRRRVSGVSKVGRDAISPDEVEDVGSGQASRESRCSFVHTCTCSERAPSGRAVHAGFKKNVTKFL